MKIPKEAAVYISLQRLETQGLGGSIHYSRAGKLAYDVYRRLPVAQRLFRLYSMHIEPRFRSEQIIRSYEAIMRQEFATLSAHIGHPKLIVGIGPGVAGLEVLISERVRQESHGAAPRIVLIDKSGIEPIQYGFSERAAVYNSLGLSRRVLELNGQPAEAIDTIDADEVGNWEERLSGRVDLITSLIAWGFHFPVRTYLDFACRTLSPSGRLILDVRRETDGLEVLNSAFRSVEVIHEDMKFQRVLARQPLAGEDRRFRIAGSRGTTMEDTPPIISVVVAMHGEVTVIGAFFDRLLPALKRLEKSFEVVCVDDGSSDDTLAQLIRYGNADPRIKVISLSRNFGKEIAMTAASTRSRARRSSSSMLISRTRPS